MRSLERKWVRSLIYNWALTLVPEPGVTCRVHSDARFCACARHSSTSVLSTCAPWFHNLFYKPTLDEEAAIYTNI